MNGKEKILSKDIEFKLKLPYDSKMKQFIKSGIKIAESVFWSFVVILAFSFFAGFGLYMGVISAHNLDVAFYGRTFTVNVLNYDPENK